MEIKNNGVTGGGGREEGEEAVRELRVDDGLDEFSERSGVELVAGELSLELPGVTIGVEDTVAEEIAESSMESIAFVVDGEVGLEDMLDDGRIGGENLAGAEGAVEGEGGGGRAVEDVGDPEDTAVFVGGDGENGTDERISPGEGEGGGRAGGVGSAGR